MIYIMVHSRSLGRRLGGTETDDLNDSDQSPVIRAKRYIESSKKSEKITTNL